MQKNLVLHLRIQKNINYHLRVFHTTITNILKATLQFFARHVHSVGYRNQKIWLNEGINFIGILHTSYLKSTVEWSFDQFIHWFNYGISHHFSHMFGCNFRPACVRVKHKLRDFSQYKFSLSTLKRFYTKSLSRYYNYKKKKIEYRMFQLYMG